MAIVKLFDLIARAFYLKRTVTEAGNIKVQLHARIDRKGNFVDIINLDPATFLEKTKTP